MKGDPGPYLNEDGDLWVPRTVPYIEARRIAKNGLEYSYRLRYAGKTNAYLVAFTHDCTCDEMCSGGEIDEDGNSMPLEDCRVAVWHFKAE